MSVVPHDPPSMDDPRCELCDVPWPCEERNRQRTEWQLIREYLRSDLYQVTDEHYADDWAARWKSPLGCCVDWTYGEHGLRIRITNDHEPERVHAETEIGSFAWLRGHLP